MRSGSVRLVWPTYCFLQISNAEGDVVSFAVAAPDGVVSAACDRDVSSLTQYLQFFLWQDSLVLDSFVGFGKTSLGLWTSDRTT